MIEIGQDMRSNSCPCGGALPRLPDRRVIRPSVRIPEAKGYFRRSSGFLRTRVALDVSDDGSGLVRNRTNRADDRLISLPLEVVITTPVVAPAILARNSIEMRLARSPTCR